MSDVVMGVDPGLHSIGICVLRDTQVVMVLQIETPPSRRKKDGHERWLRIFEQAIVDAKPSVVALEDFEPQPWRTNGKTPKGAVSLQRLIVKMRNLAQDRGVPIYIQSPSVQREYDDMVVRKMISSAMGDGYEILPHLVSATKHALFAEAMYKRQKMTGGQDG